MWFSKPASIFVARFLGLNNIFSGKRKKNFILTPIGEIKIQGAPLNTIPDGSEFTLLIRPDRMKFDSHHHQPDDQVHSFSGVIQEQNFRGSIYQVLLTVNGIDLRLDFKGGSALPGVGNQLTLYYDPTEAIQIFD